MIKIWFLDTISDVLFYLRSMQCDDVFNISGEVGSLICHNPWVFVGLTNAVKVVIFGLFNITVLAKLVINFLCLLIIDIIA